MVGFLLRAVQGQQLLLLCLPPSSLLTRVGGATFLWSFSMRY